MERVHIKGIDPSDSEKITVFPTNHKKQELM